MSDKVVYMDNNATTRVAPDVVEAMLPYFSDIYGNPSSMHSFGGQVGSNLSVAKEQVAALIGATPDELIFTSCGTESDSTAILSALQSFPEKRHIVTTRVEHPAVKNLCENIDNLTGHKHKVTQLPVNREGCWKRCQGRDCCKPSAGPSFQRAGEAYDLRCAEG